VKIQGQHAYPVSRDLVWQALMDPDVLARTLPGCDALVADGPLRFRGTLSITVGPVRGTFSGTVQLADLDPPERFHIHVHGQGAPGFMDGQGTVRLDGDAARTTVLYDLDAHVGGRVAAVGQRLLDSTARAVTRQALDGLGRQLEALSAARASAPPTRADDRAGAPPGVPAAPDRPAAPGHAAFAAGVVRHVAADLAPRGRRAAGAVAGLLAISAVGWLIWHWLG
jgi:carbon monoxide dehydrogenase subunit G